MGQGSYNAIGYGVLLSKKDWSDEATAERHEAARAKHRPEIRSAYESETPYYAVFIGGGPDDCGPSTMSLEKLKVPATAKARWAAFAKDAGITQKPQLLWIADYD